MKPTKLPWRLRATDFSRPNWQAEPTVAYELMFEFLRLSPSYALARKEAKTGLTDEEKQLLPNDFDKVRETFTLLGDVQRTLFRQWWLKRGIKAFGVPHARPRVHQIAELAAGTEGTPEYFGRALQDFSDGAWQEEGQMRTILVAVPLGRKRREIIRDIYKLLDTYGDTERYGPQKPQLTLHGQRLRKKVLLDGLRLLWFRAAKPKWELWRLGAKANISKTYSSVINPNSPRKTRDRIEEVDRAMMTKITSRAIRKFEAIVENAARGRFPVDEPIESVAFDYSKMAHVIVKRNAWQKQEKERLLREFKVKSNANTNKQTEHS